MTIKIGINGYGRIGRNILRALYESGRQDMKIVAINDLGDSATNAHLTRYDTTHGRFAGKVEVDQDRLMVNGDPIKVLAVRNPAELPWRSLDVDMVFECTGLFTSKAKASAHIHAGAKKVLISAPGGDGVDAFVVYGVNQKILAASQTVVSNASCTTNCLAPVAQVLHQHFGIVHGLMTTVHSYTNDQVLNDVYHEDLRRARGAAQNIIPTKTGAAVSVGQVLPELQGKLDGFSLRVPTLNVSLVDLTCTLAKPATKEAINAAMKEASQGALRNIMRCNDQPLVSSDFNHDPHSAIFDATQTRVMGGTFAKVLAWYDNEWGFSNRMLDTAAAWMSAK